MTSNLGNNKTSSNKTRNKKKRNNNKIKKTSKKKKESIKKKSISHQQSNSLEDLASLHRVSLAVNGSSRDALISSLTSHGAATVAIVNDFISILEAFQRIGTHPYGRHAIAPPVPGIAHTLEIIHEPTLVKRYQQARQTMIQRGIGFKERIMFHGTSSGACHKICKQGFKHRYSRTPGIYVAASAIAWKHQQSRDLTGTRQLMVCRVLIPSVQIFAHSFFSDSKQMFAHLHTGPITVVTYTHCVVPCAIIHF